jgi:hypothetical protein
MRGRVATTVVVAVMGFALSIGRANAGGDSESCLAKTMNQTKTNVDGTECEAVVSGAGPNKATAKASGLGVAVSEAEDGATTSANAKQNSKATVVVHSGTGSATSSGVGASATVEISPVGGGKANATGPNSEAISEISTLNPAGGGGNVQSNASGDGSIAVAAVEINSMSSEPGFANASAKGGSESVAAVEETGGGKAKATSSGLKAEAVSAVDNVCSVKTNAKGANSMAVGECINSGSVVSAEATKGSIAVGSDTAVPTCTPMNGGIAKVRSPMGNCG